VVATAADTCSARLLAPAFVVLIRDGRLRRRMVVACGLLPAVMIMLLRIHSKWLQILNSKKIELD